MRLSVIRHLKKRASHLAFNNVLYNWSLGGSVPDTLAVTLRDIWPGDAERGAWLCSGAFCLNGEQLELRGSNWEPVGVSENWLRHMHGFDWLRDLRALGRSEARQQACAMIEDWIAHYYDWHEFTWQPGITGRRIANWLGLLMFYAPSLEHAFQDTFFDSIARQLRHLSRALPSHADGLELLYGIKGLAYGGLAFTGREYWLEQALDLLQEEMKTQILPDGGHISRSPQQLLEALQICTDIRTGLISGEYPVPEGLEHAIDRMAQALRFFRYPDKGFALFHGSQEGNRDLIETVSLKANARGRILRALPQSGYERVTLGRSMLVVDTGTPPHYPFDDKAHVAPLAFEFAYGKERIFVSCGTHPTDPDWADVLRGTAAHNTMTIDYRNVTDIREDGHLKRPPRTVMVERQDSRDAVLLEGSHDGYVPVNGITHRRRLYLAQQGHDLRGEETLTCSVGLNKPVDIALRFHLHPRVAVSLIQDGAEALLRLGNGSGWRFFHTGGHLALEDSIYLGQGARPQKTKQLVLYGRMDSDFARIKWAVQRESL